MLDPIAIATDGYARCPESIALATEGYAGGAADKLADPFDRGFHAWKYGPPPSRDSRESLPSLPESEAGIELPADPTQVENPYLVRDDVFQDRFGDSLLADLAQADRIAASDVVSLEQCLATLSPAMRAAFEKRLAAAEAETQAVLARLPVLRQTPGTARQAVMAVLKARQKQHDQAMSILAVLQ